MLRFIGSKFKSPTKVWYDGQNGYFFQFFAISVLTLDDKKRIHPGIRVVGTEGPKSFTPLFFFGFFERYIQPVVVRHPVIVFICIDRITITAGEKSRNGREMGIRNGIRVTRAVNPRSRKRPPIRKLV